MPPETPAPTYKCRHIFADGHRCGAKSLRHEDFCYYHHTTRKPASRPAPKSSPATTTFDLPLPEDRTAIQISIGEVLRRIAGNEIDPRRAGLLLYGLQIASLNLPREPRAAAPARYTGRGRTPDSHDNHEDTPEPIEIYELDPTLGPSPPSPSTPPPKTNTPKASSPNSSGKSKKRTPHTPSSPTCKPSGAPSLTVPPAVSSRVGLQPSRNPYFTPSICP